MKALIEMHQRTAPSPASQSQSAVQTIDPLDRLEKLARLLEQGTLTQAEFDKKKAEILDL